MYFKKGVVAILLLTVTFTAFSADIGITSMLKERFPFQQLDSKFLAKLNVLEQHIILNKGTERAFSGQYYDNFEWGTYYCRQCNSPLYFSENKFEGFCGWPSFDEEIPFAVTRVPDKDGLRTEIICSTCLGHLGHVFLGEGFTSKDTRHCVNSTSLVFLAEEPVAKAVYAGGCFWGVEYLFEKLDGVYSAVSGYSGGTMDKPTYRDVLSGKTGHLEVVEVSYNPLKISYEDLTKYFLEIHDPTQTNGQGPDIGSQYLSAIFYRNRYEWETALKLISILEQKGLKIATTVRAASQFWPAEDYHQDYYRLRGQLPYCHTYQKRF